MDWTEVETKLGERAEEVCRFLLPNGHREGAEYVCGSVNGEKGDSLKVNVEGRAGLWKDFAGDKGGKTLISLWCTVRNAPFKSIIVEAKNFLGLRDDFERRVQPARPERRTDAQAEQSAWQAIEEVWRRCEKLTEGGPVWKYLVEERRIEEAVLGWYEVRQMLSNGQWVIVWPYFSGESKSALTPALSPGRGGTTPAWLKFEALERRDGKKREWTTKAPDKCLFGMQLAERKQFQDARHLLITEGEKDALSWASYGCSAWEGGMLPASVPFGAKWKGLERGRPSPNREWMDRSWEFMQGFETIFVAMDGDEEGRKAAADIINEIGPRRCRLVELPLRNPKPECPKSE